ncbi:histidinol-phosphate transaminase [Bacillus sp. FJAT-49732]|uniref:Histidinol-phosphate aminotransferase n=1 Tax=Lederbergia citrisecunda TaxID=2833583 RepID=A0A942YKA7_9BACI|nr:histidinol-phosphate transaminase [Lederbergia citrisecunda]MBS4199457.1 histidinol-phosphate transaminase [Lederbergia citrisecunda]
MQVKQQLLSLKPYIPGKTTEEVKREYQLDKIVKLASNENPYGCSPNVLEAISTKIPSFAIYPDGGTTELREKVATHLGVNGDQLIFSSGLDELIQMLIRAMLSPDTNTVMAKETFPQYRHHAIIENAELREVPLKDGRHDLEEMARQIDDKTNIVWICNPNNPTGTYVNQSELEEFLSKVPSHVLVVLDEAYFEYATIEDYPKTIPLLNKYENLLIMRTFSKAFGLAGFRIGYGIGAPTLIKQLEVARLPFNTSALAQTAAITALEDIEFVEKTIAANAKELEKYYQFFDKHQISYYPSQGNFVFINIPGLSSDEIFQSLLEKGWIVRAFPNGVRITVGKEDENEELMKILAEIVTVKL